MATILKERPVIIRIPCSQALAARVKRLEDMAAKRGLEIDLNGALSATLERLIARAEKELSPPAPAAPAPAQPRAVAPEAGVGAQPSAAPSSSDRRAHAAGRGGKGASQPRKTKPKAKPLPAKVVA